MLTIFMILRDLQTLYQISSGSRAQLLRLMYPIGASWI